jgi:hypothetical protein
VELVEPTAGLRIFGDEVIDTLGVRDDRKEENGSDHNPTGTFHVLRLLATDDLTTALRPRKQMRALGRYRFRSSGTIWMATRVIDQSGDYLLAKNYVNAKWFSTARARVRR